MTAEIYIKCGSSPGQPLTRIHSFTFVKEAFTAYTKLDAVFDAAGADVDGCSEILFYLNGRLIHHGLPDKLRITRENGAVKGFLSSRGFTSLLLDNQLAPGFYMELSLNSLVDNYFALPFITHEDSSDTSYIYVKNGSVMWDGVVNLAYKINRTHPYIAGCNTIMISPKSQPVTYSYGDGQLVDSGSEIVTTKMSSHYHMADIQGNYGSFDYTLPQAAAMNIVRHKHFELDRRFLYDPALAPVYRGNLSARGWKCRFCTYYGSNGEDLYDLLSVNNGTPLRISRIRIIGDQSGIRTELSTYEDGIVGG